MNLTLQPGTIKGNLEYAYYGYDAYDKRTDLASFNTKEDYLADLKKKKWSLLPLIHLSWLARIFTIRRLLHKFDVEIEALSQLGDGFTRIHSSLINLSRIRLS